MSVLITLNSESNCNMCNGEYVIDHDLKCEYVKHAILRRLISFQLGKDARGDSIMKMAIEEASKHGLGGDIIGAITNAVHFWLQKMEQVFSSGDMGEYTTLAQATMYLCSLKTEDMCTGPFRPIPLIQ